MFTVVETSKSRGQAMPQVVRLGFNARPFHMALIVDQVALTYIFLQVLQFFLVIIIPPIPHTHSFIHQQYIILVRNDILKNKDLNTASKLQVCKSILRPIVTYGCETGAKTVTEQNCLLVLERRVLRKIYGPTQDNDGAWRTKNKGRIRKAN